MVFNLFAGRTLFRYFFSYRTMHFKPCLCCIEFLFRLFIVIYLLRHTHAYIQYTKVVVLLIDFSYLFDFCFNTYK